MNKVELVKWQLEENVKKREKLKLEFTEKTKEYLDAKSELESEEFVEEITKRKEFLQALQESHKKEMDEAKRSYGELKSKVTFALKTLKDELGSITKELTVTKRENKKLNKNKEKLKDLEDVQVTNHAIVQYLDRAKGMNLTKVRKEIREKLIKNGIKIKPSTKIQDPAVVSYLVEQGIIDLEKIRDEILPEELKGVMLRKELVGSTGTFTTKGGFRLVAKNGKVVTFLPRPEKKKKNFYGKRERTKRKIRKMKL